MSSKIKPWQKRKPKHKGPNGHKEGHGFRRLKHVIFTPPVPPDEPIAS